MLRFLTTNDVLAFFFGEFFLIARVLIENQPRDCPGEAQHAGNDESHLPAVHHDSPHHQRRRNHRPDGRTHVEVADSNRALFCREPLGTGLQSRRDHRGFCRTDRTARQRQAAPAARQRGGSAEHRPGDGEEGIADFGTEDIQHVACNRLHDGVRRGIGSNDVGVLLRGDMQLFH